MERCIRAQAGLIVCLLLFFCLRASGQVAPAKQEFGKDDDPVAILEIGAASNWNFSGGATTFAPNLAAEITPDRELAGA